MGVTNPTSGAWLLCDGSTFDRNTYPNLYAFLGGNVLPKIIDENVYTKIIYSVKNGTNTGVISVSDVVIPNASKVTSIQVGGQPRSNQLDCVFFAVDLTIATELYCGFGGNSYVIRIYGAYNSSNDTWVASSFESDAVQIIKCFYNEKVFGATDNYKIIKAISPTDHFTPSSSEVQEIVTNCTNYTNVKMSYSTTEQWTGGYWIDGKKIYKKTFYSETESFSNNTHFEVPYINDLVDESLMMRSSGYESFMPIVSNVYGSGSSSYVTTTYSQGGGYSKGKSWTLQYTKIID